MNLIKYRTTTNPSVAIKEIINLEFFSFIVKAFFSKYKTAALYCFRQNSINDLNTIVCWIK